jgi:hypothetical protein
LTSGDFILPSNVVKIKLPTVKIERDKKNEVKKIRVKFSLIPIITQVLQNQKVEDIKGALLYLMSLLDSKDDLTLP